MADLLALTLSGFALGIISGANPCALPLVPGFIGYLSTRTNELGSYERSFIGIIVVLGVISGMVGFAVAATAFHTSLGGLLTVATPVVIVVLLLFGTLLIVNHNPFYRLPQVRLPQARSSLLLAYAYGGLYGVIALPCSSLVILPFTIAVSLSGVAALSAFVIFLSFGLGLGLPVIVVSLLSRAQGDWLVKQMARRSRAMNMVAGAILIGVAIYDLLVVQQLIGVYL
jgi:cytochrome c-type biogenesis protein